MGIYPFKVLPWEHILVLIQIENYDLICHKTIFIALDPCSSCVHNNILGEKRDIEKKTQTLILFYFIIFSNTNFKICIHPQSDFSFLIGDCTS